MPKTNESPARETGAGVPVSIFLSDSCNMALHWTDTLELIFVLSGSLSICQGEEQYTLADGDVVLVNPHVLHAYSSQDCIHMICQINLKSLPLLRDQSSGRFVVNSVRYPHPSKYSRLRVLMSKLIKVQSQDDANCGTMSVVYEIMSELIMHFTSERTELHQGQETKYAKRTRAILNYIIENYRQGLTLQQVAEAQYLSAPYLSSFFKKNIGMNFTDYYNNLRLQYAVTDLLTTDLSIEDVVHQNGFSDSRTFLRLFKEKYRMLPSVFRRQNYCGSGLQSGQGSAAGLFYPSIGKSAYLPMLNQYLEPENTPLEPIGLRPVQCGDVHCGAKGELLKHNFHKFCSVSSAKSLLFSDVQNMLRSLQEEIGFEYISFYGLLNIDPYLYSERPDGTPVFTFTLVDKIFDFLLSINLKPLVNFSYMPFQLGVTTTEVQNNYLFNTIPPKNYEHWTMLITQLTCHLVSRYGENSVSQWLFNLWKKPDVAIFSIGDTEFFRLYQATYAAVKSVSPRLRFGTPCLACNSSEAKAWDSRFIDFCKSSRCSPDFLCFAYYNDIFPEDSGKRLYLETKSQLSKDPDSYARFVDEVEGFCQEKKLAHLPAYMLQWNLTVSQRNLINDTCFSSCYIMKNLLETYDRMDSFCYWTISDFSEETELPSDLFFGGIGMFTHNAIKKASYYPFYFASMLGDERLGQGKGWFVTRSYEKQKIVIIFYNYEHYDDNFAEGKTYDVTLTRRYTHFLQMKPARFSLKLDQLESEYCCIKELFINRGNGSVYDRWSAMGGVPLQGDELSFLRVTQPGMLIHTEKINNGILHVEADLQPLEIRLVEIELRGDSPRSSSSEVS